MIDLQLFLDYLDVERAWRMAAKIHGFGSEAASVCVNTHTTRQQRDNWQRMFDADVERHPIVPESPHLPHAEVSS